MEPHFDNINIHLSLVESECYFDKDKTLEAIINVLNNKARFAKTTIHIKIEETNLQTLLFISVDGEGINPKTKDKIFTRFYSGTNKTSQSIGIGLPIAKEIMLNQEGSLMIEDANTFVFKFTKLL